MSVSQVPDGTLVHRGWMVRGDVGGVAHRWGAVVLTITGEERARCHVCLDDPGHGIRTFRTRGDAFRLMEAAQTKALKFSAALGDAPIRRYGGGTIQEFNDWFRRKEDDIPTIPSDEYLEEQWKSLG